RTGQGHVCENWVGLGYDVDGCFAEYMVLPDRNVWKNHPSLSPEVCAIQDPLGNAVHSVFATDCVGKTVAVFGMGPVGLLSVAVLKAIGAREIIAVEKGNQYRMDLARKVGATVVINADEVDDIPAAIRTIVGGKGVDVSMEMAGAQRSIIDAIECVRPNGHAVLLGIPNGSVPFKVTEDVIFKSLHIHGITGRAIWGTWYRMAALLESGHLDLTPIITHSFPFTEYQKGFDIMAKGTCGKVILTF
ncbi:zinc-binding dehydrogenase, partial [Myxococcota bacterium]|nr:zinc-binding dehydrogenase [Myxococcota bacterium]